MPQGTIKKLVADKGFGFINGEKGDLFFHHSAVEGRPSSRSASARPWNTSKAGGRKVRGRRT